MSPGFSPDWVNSIRYAVSQAVGRQAASSNDSPAGFGTTFCRGTATRSASVPWYRSLSSDRFGSSVSSPRQAGSAITACTTTSLPSASIPAASQPRIIGSLSSDSPTPFSDHRSWWFSAVALTSTVVHPSGTSGSGRSPTSSAETGSSGANLAAYAASMRLTLGGYVCQARATPSRRAAAATAAATAGATRGSNGDGIT